MPGLIQQAFCDAAVRTSLRREQKRQRFFRRFLPFSGQKAGSVIDFALLEFLRFSVVPVLYGPIISGDPAVYFGFAVADGTFVLLSGKITVVLANRIGGGKRVVGKLVVFGDFPYESGRGMPFRELFTEKCVKNRSGSIQRLQLVLDVQSGEQIVRISHGKMRAVCIIRDALLLGSRNDIRILPDVMLSQTVGGGLRGRRFEVVQISVLGS